MEIELEPRVKPLAYKVKGMSRESTPQKAAHVLDSDLRTHWSTGTNTKEWILLELDEPCLLSHTRIYNKSVLEWEIAVGLRFKPESFVKVRPRCEAPRRDMLYPTNYTPCRYVRISCLRGNPISVFFIQLIGVSVPALEAEFQPVVNCLLPHIMVHKKDAHDTHFQLLQDMTSRLRPFIPQLETDLSNFSDAAEANLRFLAMLAGPFYPILHVVSERETLKSSLHVPDADNFRNSQPPSSITVSSNFEPRRPRGACPFALPISSSSPFHPDAIFVLLRKAYKESNLGTVCRMAARVLQKFLDPATVNESSIPLNESGTSFLDAPLKSDLSSSMPLVDYSNLFGEEFQIPDDHWDSSYLNILDIGAVEEGILHVLFACALQPELCSKLAGSASYLWDALPLVQALLPALRPSVTCSSDHVDDSFSKWLQPFVQQAASQIVSTLSSSFYRPLLHSCAGYLSSFASSHAKAACVLIDLCFGVLAPWMSVVTAKVDLTLELLGDLLGTIQVAHSFFNHARACAAVKYVVLALSGHLDDILAKFKEAKYRILFLIEMLEPFLDPVIAGSRSTVDFENLSSHFAEKQQQTCAIALNIIRIAVQKFSVLPSLESEWRRGKVAPSVVLSILEPHMLLPPEIDLCKATPKSSEHESSTLPSHVNCNDGTSSKSHFHDDFEGKAEASDAALKVDTFEDASLFFAPPELRSMSLTASLTHSVENNLQSCFDVSLNERSKVEKITTNLSHCGSVLDAGFAFDCFDLHADYIQLMNYQDCEHKASEFRRLALDLCSQGDCGPEGHEAAVDALLLAAECYVNPFLMMSVRPSLKASKHDRINVAGPPKDDGLSELKKVFEKCFNNLETVSCLERERDKIVLQILLEAAELDRNYRKINTGAEHYSHDIEETNKLVLNLSQVDKKYVDAITLVRQNQALLCNFLMKQLLKEQHSMHEILMQSLLFYLHSATKLYCTPEDVINVILGSAEYLNGLLQSLYSELKESNVQLDSEKVHGVKRRWMLLQRLVMASSFADEGSDVAINVSGGFQYENLIPPASWLEKISTFSNSAFPLVRFFGWMAVSRNAKQSLKGQIFLVPTLPQLKELLSIFSDELAAVDNVVNQKDKDASIGLELSCQQDGDHSFFALYPELNKFFPNMKKQFEAFGLVILEAIGLQLRSFSSSCVPDILCWFSDLCSSPFPHMGKSFCQNDFNHFKGFVGKNAKAIILFILEAIVAEHMEAMVPEIPRVVRVLASLCRTSYCDVPFLNSVLLLLKPIISYSLSNVSDDEKLLADDSCSNFESLCFDELFIDIRNDYENQDGPPKSCCKALTMYILAFLFMDLSFQRKKGFLQSLASLSDFAVSEPTASFYDYLSAFQIVMENCEALLVHMLRAFGAIPLQASHFSNVVDSTVDVGTPDPHSWFLIDLCHGIYPTEASENLKTNESDAIMSNPKAHSFSAEEIIIFTTELDTVICNLIPTIELCWKLHHQLAKKLTLKTARCFMFSRCLSSISQNMQVDPSEGLSTSPNQFEVCWNVGLQGLAKMILSLQKNCCWEVSSLLQDCLLGLPKCFCLSIVAGGVCSAIKHFTCAAPKIAWRLQTDRWLLILFARGLHYSHDGEAPLVDLLCTLLGHSEPEQRNVALQHLQRFVSKHANETEVSSSSARYRIVSHDSRNSAFERALCLLVSRTWDQVASMASSDSSSLLRTRAMALLADYIPFTDRHRLQSFLAAADTILYGFGNFSQPTSESPITRVSLALIGNACLYSTDEDISLIPEKIWNFFETLGMSKSDKWVGHHEKILCQALCRLRDARDEDKKMLKEALLQSDLKEYDPQFGSTRDLVLQVMANLTSAKSYFEFFSTKADQEKIALEEAEIEMDIIQREPTQEDPSLDFKGRLKDFVVSSNVMNENRLQQIKDSIHNIEKSRLTEEIAARRQKKLLLSRARQKYLEEAAYQEAKLLQEFDRERTAENEKEIERQRLLELERSKTRELRHILDMEKERQTQREIQRELEQAESGIRTSRREFSSHGSRPREKYRDREIGRGAASGVQSDAAGMPPPAPPVILSGLSRPFSSSQMPMILQSRDRPDEGGNSYEENFDGGDTGSAGDSELASAFDGQFGGFGGSGQRLGSSRGSRSKVVMERRERENRREGKWERKYF